MQSVTGEFTERSSIKLAFNMLIDIFVAALNLLGSTCFPFCLLVIQTKRIKNSEDTYSVH